MTSGEFLKKKRKDKKMSLRQIAYKTNLSHTYISEIEKGKLKGTFETQEKICTALDMNESEIKEFLNISKNEQLSIDAKEKIMELKIEIEDLKQKLQDCESKLAITHNGVGQIVVGNNNQIGSSKILPDEFDLGELSEERMEELRRFIKYLKNS